MATARTALFVLFTWQLVKYHSNTTHNQTKGSYCIFNVFLDIRLYTQLYDTEYSILPINCANLLNAYHHNAQPYEPGGEGNQLPPKPQKNLDKIKFFRAAARNYLGKINFFVHRKQVTCAGQTFQI